MPRRRSTLPRVALLLVALAALGGWLAFRDELREARARQRVPRVVLVTLDTLHVGYTGPYNPQVENTPNLDRFAEEGTLFRRAYTTVPITLPAHASLMSGRRPDEIGVLVNGDRVPGEVETLAEILGARGYRTAAFVSLGVLRANFEMAQGFDHYDDEFLDDANRWYRTADEVVGAAGDWIREQGDESFFAWVHVSDPHEPYRAHDAGPDTRLTLDGEIIGEWGLTTKEKQRVELELSPGRHELTWTSLREPRPDDRAESGVALKLTDPGALSDWLPEGAAGPPEEILLAPSYSLELFHRGPAPATVELRFEGLLAAPPPSEVREHYTREVAYTDRYLGELRRLVDSLGSPEKTLWVLASDHGEGLHHLDILGHAAYVQEDQLRILWMMKGPGVEPGRVVDESAVLASDLLPTLLDLMGLPTPAAVTGRSQAGCWRRTGCSPREEWWAYGAAAESGTVTGVAGYRGDYKLLWQEEPRSGCYRLPDDPWEEVNLGTPMTRNPDLIPPEVAALNARIYEERDRIQARLDAREATGRSAEEIEMLRSLGYLGN